MILAKTGHPRKRDWWRYRCDRCGDTFWGPEIEGGVVDREHQCFDCTRPTMTGVGNPHVGLNTLDADPDSYGRSDAAQDPS